MSMARARLSQELPVAGAQQWPEAPVKNTFIAWRLDDFDDFDVARTAARRCASAPASFNGATLRKVFLISGCPFGAILLNSGPSRPRQTS